MVLLLGLSIRWLRVQVPSSSPLTRPAKPVVIGLAARRAPEAVEARTTLHAASKSAVCTHPVPSERPLATSAGRGRARNRVGILAVARAGGR